jgi:hypothetical protein
VAQVVSQVKVVRVVAVRLPPAGKDKDQAAVVPE